MRPLSTLSLLACLALAACHTCPEPMAPPSSQPASAPAAAPVDLDALEGRTLLLVSHPSKRIVQVMHALVQQKVLDVSRLFVVGLHHQKEAEDYSSSRAYLQKHGLSWMAIKALTCDIDRDSIFKHNGCSAVFADLMARSAGVVFTGGADLPPSIYGEKTLLTTVIRTPHRQHWELSFLFHLLGSSRNAAHTPLLAKRPGYPVLAICLGMQTLNVATGGTLIQDIPSEVYGVKTFEEAAALGPDKLHRNATHRLHPERGLGPGVYHPVKLTHPLLATLHGGAEPVRVLSIHHQAVEQLGQNLEIIATSPDGKIVEGVRHQKFSGVLGVQFHPEYYVMDRKLPASGRPLARVPMTPPVRQFHERLWKRFAGLLVPPKQ